MDFQRLASSLLRELRLQAGLSQSQLNEALGLRYNQCFRWESSYSHASWLDLISVCKILKRDLASAIADITGASMINAQLDPADFSKLAQILLEDPEAELAAAAAVTSYRSHRWLSGKVPPKLFEMLRMFDSAVPWSLPILVDRLVPERVGQLEGGDDRLRLHQRSVGLHRDHPYAGAVLHALQLKQYQDMDGHREGWVAKTIGITQAQERMVLDRLLREELIEARNGKFFPKTNYLVVKGDEVTRSYWLARAQQVLASRSHTRSSYDKFGYLAYCVSPDAQKEIEGAYRRFHCEVQQICLRDADQPSVLGLLNTQMLELSGHSCART